MIDYGPFARFILKYAEVWCSEDYVDAVYVLRIRDSDGWIYFWPEDGTFIHSCWSPEVRGYYRLDNQPL